MTRVDCSVLYCTVLFWTGLTLRSTATAVVVFLREFVVCYGRVYKRIEGFDQCFKL